MKVEWLSAEALKNLRLSVAEPFEAWEWWEALGERWGGLTCIEGSTVRAVWLLAERQWGPLRLWRQPLAVPYAPIVWAGGEGQLSYAKQAPILRAVGAYVGQRWFRGIAGTLPPAWSYLPPLWQVGLRPQVAGSFILRDFQPRRELRRKLRQAADLPLRELPSGEAMAFWQRHAPSAIYPKFRQQMERLTMGAFPWRLIGIGEPLQAVAFFLWGCARVWYFASAHHQSHPQAITKILAYAIMGAIAEGKTFDFMGSVLPGVERFFWQFGGTWETRYVLQTPWLSFFSR